TGPVKRSTTAALWKTDAWREVGSQQSEASSSGRQPSTRLQRDTAKTSGLLLSGCRFLTGYGKDLRTASLWMPFSNGIRQRPPDCFSLDAVFQRDTAKTSGLLLSGCRFLTGYGKDLRTDSLWIPFSNGIRQRLPD